MPSPLLQAGAQPRKPSHFGSLHQNRFWTGLWTQRSQLRDAATSFVYEKFYSASRFDSLIDGSNVEITNALTLGRRPGLSVYNSQTFTGVDSFYEFKLFSGASESIKVVADTATNVYDATGPSTKTLIFAKDALAGQTYFQSVGNTLYMGDGVEEKKWVQSVLAWTASTEYDRGQFLVDTNGKIQAVSHVLAGTLANAIASTVAITSNILTVYVTPQFSQDQLNDLLGEDVTFKNVVTASFLNDQTVTVTAVNNAVVAATAVTQITATFTHADYVAATDSGLMFTDSFASSFTGHSGTVLPTFSGTTGGTVVDSGATGAVIWTCKGSAVQKWGIDAPTAQPTVALTPIASQYGAWAANTFFAPNQIVLDNQATTHIWALTTAGTTGAVQPTWLVSPQADGSATWTDRGVSAWQAAHTYTIGQYIAVVYATSTTFEFRTRYSVDAVRTITTNHFDFFKAVSITGNSGATHPTWLPGNGTQVKDGGVTWQNLGVVVTWDGRTVSSVVTTGIGALTAVSASNQIADTNGNIETVSAPGKSGATVPAWKVAAGGVTSDGTKLLWLNQGAAFSNANTASWIYAFSYKNSVTRHVGTASPISNSVLQPAGYYVTVGGPSSTDTQVDTIEIYRTSQGGGILMFLADVAMPTDGSPWSFADTLTDVQLNPFITAPLDHANDAPPSGLIALSYHLQRVFGSVGNTTYFSGGPDTSPGSGNESFPPANVFVWPSQVVRHEPLALGLLVHTVSDIYLIAGQGTANSPLFAVPFLKGVGLASYNGYAVNGSLVQMFTSDGQLISLDPSSGVSEIGFPIGDRLSALTPSSVYVTWHVAGSQDKALYISDGTSSWYRLNPTSAPESGLTWSPAATVTAGFKAVQSIEVTPGVKRLLVGPSGTGQILQRDTSVYADNGTTYTASATIGSIVLTQPGSLAELNFITTECMGVGSRVAVSVLIDEISGQAGTPAFTTLPTRTNDPPALTASTSLYSDRWYFSPAALPAWCRHLQIRFDWPAENFHNEMLAYTIQGAFHDEV